MQIFMTQEIMGWQWHQLHDMQIICTLLQTDNDASMSSLNFTGLLKRNGKFSCQLSDMATKHRPQYEE